MFRHLLLISLASMVLCPSVRGQICRIEWMRGSHLGSVEAVCFLSGEDTLVSASLDGSIKYWDISSGHLLRTVPLASGATCLSVSRDCALAAVVDGTGRCVVVELPSWRPLLEITQREVAAVCASIGRDGSRVAVGFTDGTARLYRIPGGELVWTAADSRGRITAIDVSGDGTMVATTATDYTTRIYDAATGAPLQLIQEVQQSSDAVAFDPESRLVATLGYDSLAFREDIGRYRGLVLFDAATGASVAQLHHWYNRPISAITFSRDGRYVASSSYESGRLKYYDGTSIDVSDQLHRKREWLYLQELSAGWPTSLAITPLTRFLAWGNTSGMVRVTPFAAEDSPDLIDSNIRTLTGHRGAVSAMAISPDGTTLVTADSLGEMRVWRAGDGAPLKTISNAHTMNISRLAFSPEGDILTSSSADGSVKIWAADGMALQRTIILSADCAIGSVAAARRGRFYAVIGFPDSVVVRVDSGSQRPTASYEMPGGEITAMALSRDETRLAAATRFGTLRVWDAESGALLTESAFDTPILSLAFAASQRDLLLAGGDDGGLRLIEAATGSTLDRADRPRGAPVAISCSAADGIDYVAASGRDSVVMIYRIGPEQLINVGSAAGYPARHTGVVLDAARLTMMTGTSDASLIRWSLSESSPAPPAPPAVSCSLGSVVPHPLRGFAAVRFSVATRQHVRIAIYDLPGRPVATIADRMFDAGEHVVDVPADRLAPATYILRFDSPELTIGRPIVVLR